MIYHVAFSPYFDSIEGLAPVTERHTKPATPNDDDILPECEFNLTVLKRKASTFWKKTPVVEHCHNTARWVLVIDVDECIPNHDHVVLVCNDHKNTFRKPNVDKFDCPELPGPSPNFWVAAVESL